MKSCDTCEHYVEGGPKTGQCTRYPTHVFVSLPHHCGEWLGTPCLVCGIGGCDATHLPLYMGEAALNEPELRIVGAEIVDKGITGSPVTDWSTTYPPDAAADEDPGWLKQATVVSPESWPETGEPFPIAEPPAGSSSDAELWQAMLAAHGQPKPAKKAAPKKGGKK